MKVAAFAIVLVMSAVSPASAQWLHNAEDDPFKGKATHVAMTAKAGQFAGFRCSGQDDLALLFSIPEKVTSDATKLLNLASLKLLVIVDDLPKIELDAEMQITPDGNTYRLEADSDEVAKIVHAVAGAKRRFAVASEMMGKTFYSTVFGVDGSRSALNKLISGCKIAAVPKS
jgi:hypothetical protein